MRRGQFEIRPRCLFPFLFEGRGEEKRKKGRGKREKKAEKRVYKGFPRCGRGRKRNLGYYKEISIYFEVVK